MNHSQSLFCQEQIAQDCSFVMSDKIKSLLSLFKKEQREWRANEQKSNLSEERMSKRANSQPRLCDICTYHCNFREALLLFTPLCQCKFCKVLNALPFFICVWIGLKLNNSLVRDAIYVAKTNLNLRMKTEHVTVEADETIYCMSGFRNHVSSPETSRAGSVCMWF